MRPFLITVAVLFATSVAFAAPRTWTAPAAAADAQRDIREHKIKICLWGGYAPQPVGIPDRYRRLIRQYPTVMVGQGCIVSDEALNLRQREYAETYNARVLKYILQKH